MEHPKFYVPYFFLEKSRFSELVQTGRIRADLILKTRLSTALMRGQAEIVDHRVVSFFRIVKTDKNRSSKLVQKAVRKRLSRKHILKRLQPIPSVYPPLVSLDSSS